MATQKERILTRLQAGDVLTRRSILDDLGIWEGPARISELKQEGWNIKTKMITVPGRHGRARIAEWYLEGLSIVNCTFDNAGQSILI